MLKIKICVQMDYFVALEQAARPTASISSVTNLTS